MRRSSKDSLDEAKLRRPKSSMHSTPFSPATTSSRSGAPRYRTDVKERPSEIVSRNMLRSAHSTRNEAKTLPHPHTRKETTPTFEKPTERDNLPDQFHMDAIRIGQGDIMMSFLWFLAAAPGMVLVCLTLLYLYSKKKVHSAQKRKKLSTGRRKKSSGSGEAQDAHEVQFESLDLKEFKDKGPLVMQYSFRGDVKHALQDVPSASIKNIMFDTSQNSLVKIGTEVELLERGSQRNSRTIILHERKSSEDLKAQAFASETLTSGQDYKVQKSSQNSSTTTRERDHSEGTK
ncbi:hypothetical protein Y032_0016g2913 [Ancylostoma ceylanicum]|uniref:Uncharacterized protein n=1 Tax=Ancylostoma ceylanicum TaxID=53326 RepID=A0A016V628_9BILA|nr:hypothetical protein Y032_0016g2913 [Ancylostoma ceylanicum]